ncbi:MAG: hypothetical protein ABIR17_08945 [Pseudolysinimonas sp.]|uniref:hypothetical protein n=1 Tax=Pseudolysinimonas sp. TaxID=2680009 RepID=UPI00326466B8
MADQLDDIAQELYGLPPAQFISARTAAAEANRTEPGFGARLRALRRPAPAAWVVNLLARERCGELDEVLDLGIALRAAQTSLDREAITRLGKERRAAVTGLAHTGGELAEAAGHPVTAAVLDAVAGTLDAGLADAEAAEAIRTGRLVRALETIGFEPVDLAEAVALPGRGSRAAEKRAVVERPKPHLVDDGDAELARARTRADAVAKRADDDAAEIARQLGDLDLRLREARKTLSAAEREAAAIERQRDVVADTHEKARLTLDTALARRRELG